MYEVYTWGTPNGFKPLIMLEELGLPYDLRKIDLGKGEQKRPDYLALNPNGKIPTLVDERDGERITIFESAAILIYLAEETGRLLPTEKEPRFTVLEWLMFQIGAIGPTFGQFGAFSRAEPKVQPAIDKFRVECERLAGVLDGHLAGREWLGEDYSIADIATFPWIRAADFVGLQLSGAPNLTAWMNRVGDRPAVRRALALFPPPRRPS